MPDWSAGHDRAVRIGSSFGGCMLFADGILYLFYGLNACRYTLFITPYHVYGEQIIQVGSIQEVHIDLITTWDLGLANDQLKSFASFSDFGLYG